MRGRGMGYRKEAGGANGAIVDYAVPQRTVTDLTKF
jgi:hypothetical protein